MPFPCLFLWPCSYLQDKEKESNQSALGIKLPVQNLLPGTPLLSSTHLQHLMLPEKISHLPEEQIGQVRRIQGSMWRQAQQNTPHCSRVLIFNILCFPRRYHICLRNK
ncbi:hypothetical protein ACFX14_000239 [Malus domestica]